MTQAKAILTLIASVFLCLPASPSSAQTPQRIRELKREQTQSAKRRLALVIGNGAYTNASPLKNPPNDARDMAESLKEFGFEVTSGVDINQREMKRLIREYGQKLKTGGVGLFYYAGHGVQSKGRNYLIPVEADIQSEAEIEDASVDINLVLNYMDEAQNDLNIVILDACRNNPFARSFRSSSNGLAPLDPPTGTLVGYATAPGRVASDGSGRNGLYTSELLNQMRVPGLSLIEMFMRVRAEVMRQSGKKQVPWEASSLVGTFYFIAANAYAKPNPTDGPNSINDGRVEPLPPRLPKRGAKSSKVFYWTGVRNDTHSDLDMSLFFRLIPEFDAPFIASLERAGLTILRSQQLSDRDRQQLIGLSNALSRGERSEMRSLAAAVYLDSTISINDMPQYAQMHITVCQISLRLIDLEEGKTITHEQTREAKGFGNDQEQARRNCLREASNLVPQTFIDKVKESAW
jgi:hypothetical protein